jgi:pyruvate formate lyase activating enzyme
MHWVRSDNNAARCGLCAQRCLIQEGKRGLCQVRENRGGQLYSLLYGRASSVAVDPVEKKPLNHFHPGSLVLSMGAVGCNFKCRHCQNSGISCATVETYPLKEISAETVVQKTLETNCQGIAWTYNEPTIWYEFTLEASRLAKNKGLYSIYVSNGYISEDALREHSDCLDAMNIDVKAFTDEFYKKIAGARLQPVLDTCALARELGIHIELTYLIIPGHNDSDSELAAYCKWVAETLGTEVPLHFSRFHPDHLMKGDPPTPIETLERAFNIATGNGMEFVYIGNVAMRREENTYCPSCGKLLIERSRFYHTSINMNGNACPNCNKKVPGVF